jgi:hypothetical protein
LLAGPPEPAFEQSVNEVATAVALVLMRYELARKVGLAMMVESACVQSKVLSRG